MDKHVSPEQLEAAKARLKDATSGGPTPLDGLSKSRTAFPSEPFGGDPGTFIAVEWGLSEEEKLTSYATLVNATGDPQGPTVEGAKCPPWCEDPPIGP